MIAAIIAGITTSLVIKSLALMANSKAKKD